MEVTVNHTTNEPVYFPGYFVEYRVDKDKKKDRAMVIEFPVEKRVAMLDVLFEIARDQTVEADVRVQAAEAFIDKGDVTVFWTRAPDATLVDSSVAK